MQNKVIISKEFAQEITQIVVGATKSIDIIVFDWRWYPNELGEPIQVFNNAIFLANKRGVNVRVIVQRRLIRVILQKLGIKVKELHSKNLLHTKLIIVDDEVAIVGSHNYTKNAFNLNYEVSIMVRDQESIKRLKEYFNNLYL